MATAKQDLRILSNDSSNFLRSEIYSNVTSKDLISDIQVLTNSVKNNTRMFLEDNIDMTSKNKESEWKSEVTETLYNIFGILVKSDVNQALSMDFIALLVNYLDKVKDITYEEMSDNGLLDNVFNIIGKENIDQIKQKIYNPIFVNSLASKSLSFQEKNFELNKILLEIENSSLTNKYNNVNIYDFLKFLNKKDVGKLNDSNIDKLVDNTIPEFDDTQSPSVLRDKENGSILYTLSKSNFYESDYHTFNLQIADVFNLSPDSLIMLNVNLVDHENLNRVYLPKTFVFSPLITFNTYNNTNEFIFYNIFSDSLFDRLINISYTDLKDSDELKDYFTSTISSKKSILVERNPFFAENLFKYIIKCHLGSGQIGLINKDINCIDLEYAKNGNSETNQEIIDLFSSLDDLSFYNTFNINKDDAMMHMTKEGNNWNLPTIIKSFSLGTTFFDNCKALCDITGRKELQNINNVVYDTYNIHVNPKDFVFFEIYDGATPNSSNEVILSDSEESLLKMFGFNVSVLSDRVLYRNVDILNDNYSVEISYEII